MGCLAGTAPSRFKAFTEDVVFFINDEDDEEACEEVDSEGDDGDSKDNNGGGTSLGDGEVCKGAQMESKTGAGENVSTIADDDDDCESSNGTDEAAGAAGESDGGRNDKFRKNYDRICSFLAAQILVHI